MRRRLIVMELVGITQIEECFKDIGLHIYSVRRKSRKALSLSTVSMPLRPTGRRKTRCLAGGTYHAEVKERFAELNIACAKVLTVRNWKAIHSMLPVNQSLSGKHGWSHLQRAEHHAEIQK